MDPTVRCHGNWEIHESRDTAHLVIQPISDQRSTAPTGFSEKVEEIVDLLESLKHSVSSGGQQDRGSDPTSVSVRSIKAKPLPESLKLTSAVRALLIGQLADAYAPGLLILAIGIATVGLMAAYGLSLWALVLMVGLELSIQFVHWKHTRAPSQEHQLCEKVALQIFESTNGRGGGAQSSYGARNVVEVEDQHSGAKIWKQRLSLSVATRRGLGTVGLSFLGYLMVRYVLGLQYELSVLVCCVLYDLGLGRPGIDRKNLPVCLFQTIVNTSLATYFDSNSGNCILHNVCLPVDKDRIFFLPQVTFHLCHAGPLSKVTHATVTKSSTKPGSVPQVTEVISEDPDDITGLVVLCWGYKSHAAATHMWANGVKEIEKVWPAARKAHDLVQWFNYADTHLSHFAQPTSAGPVCAALISGIQDGFPMHNHVPQQILVQSKMHKMALSCRATLWEMWGQAVPKWVVNSVLCTTFCHSADHYYLNLHTAYNSQCGLLGVDMTLLRVTLLSPKKYFLARTLCRERLEDPVCRALYEACLPIDPEFANHGLTFSICA